MAEHSVRVAADGELYTFVQFQVADQKWQRATHITAAATAPAVAATEHNYSKLHCSSIPAPCVSDGAQPAAANPANIPEQQQQQQPAASPLCARRLHLHLGCKCGDDPQCLREQRHKKNCEALEQAVRESRDHQPRQPQQQDVHATEQNNNAMPSPATHAVSMQAASSITQPAATEHKTCNMCAMCEICPGTTTYISDCCSNQVDVDTAVADASSPHVDLDPCVSLAFNQLRARCAELRLSMSRNAVRRHPDTLALKAALAEAKLRSASGPATAVPVRLKNWKCSTCSYTENQGDTWSCARCTASWIRIVRPIDCPRNWLCNRCGYSENHCSTWNCARPNCTAPWVSYEPRPARRTAQQGKAVTVRVQENRRAVAALSSSVAMPLTLPTTSSTTFVYNSDNDSPNDRYIHVRS